MTRNIQQEIIHILSDNKIVLFVKGTPEQPACGFSARAIALLKANDVKDYKTINILEDEEMRAGIKIYSNWPTIPQLYVNKEFIGGSDIMTELHTSNELKTILHS